ncbi:nucleotidyltransferase family protein [Methylomonas sp. ZR1]|uniref:nucleotidyltransferase domain-containing protein n=1 Tax=Methylomonas sp. ZR1 TaxID=1797072 RepID=UPI0020A5C714|nr:nucleotidyltransferase family protein [Methylomonas sp. ZR1]
MMPDLLNEYLMLKAKDSIDSNSDWELLLRQARSAGVLARLAFFQKKFLLFNPPQHFAYHLDSAETYWLSQKRIVNWELHNLLQVFKLLNIRLILLKGTAYSASGLNAGLGRVFSDIDILVPKTQLKQVKDALKWHGWLPEPMDNYDQRYYEQWMHELPPLRHIKRGTSLDIHHNILPQTCNLYPDAELLLKAAVKITDTDYWVLAPEDMVLHSASHLFWGGEFENGLRDLSDIDLLLREFSGNDPSFWENLHHRAEMLGLGKPLFYALRYATKILATPVPESVIEASTIYAGGGKNRVMDYLFSQALKPHHSSCMDSLTGFARWLLFLRSHWLKMPLHILVPHLIRKAWFRLADNTKTT